MPEATAPLSAAKKPLSTAESITALIEKLYPFHYRVIGPGNDEAVPLYLEELDFTVHEYAEDQELNGWHIPKAETITKAEIRKDGELIYDGLDSPLGLILACQPFEGEVSLEELQNHLHYHTQDPSAIPFHCTQQYRPGQKDWGFCVTQELYDSLKDGTYQVDIQVEHAPTTMKVLDYTLPGNSSDTIVIQAHNCHPYQANDDISGCAVGIRLLQHLATQENRYYTYRLLICPELTGTLFWLHQSVEKPEDLKAGIILPVLGNDAPLKLQESFTGETFIDHAAHKILADRYGEYESGAFRTVYGNDETIFEAPGFSIPTISLTRYPFPEYHSNKDTPELLSEDRLQDSLEALIDICAELETDPEIKNTKLSFQGKGLYCLSHPDYGLYKKVYDPSDKHGPKNRDEGRAWNKLMTDMPRHMENTTTVGDLAARYDLPLHEVHEYCMQWVESGLAKIEE